MLTLCIRLRVTVGLAAFAALVGGCGGSGAIPLARLVADQDAYVGKEVRTSGRVDEQTNVDGSHYYVLADRAQDLVVLDPTRRARAYAGRTVSVTGRFNFNAHVGRLIRIARISAAR